MSAHRHLDSLIAKHAEEFARHVRAAAKFAEKEEDIRAAAIEALHVIQQRAGITLDVRHEAAVYSGRIDSRYGRVIVEYKNPNAPGARIGDTLESPGSRKLVEQIQARFRDLLPEMDKLDKALFGVGCDGNKFIFVRYRKSGAKPEWEIQPPVDVDRHSAERFLWALFNLGQKGKEYSPEYLAGDFGSESELATHGVRVLYDAIRHAEHPKARTFFNQWKILFGEVCGYDVDDPSDKMKLLAKGYDIPGKVHPAELLFAVHTYYALFMKLLAEGLMVASLGAMPGKAVAKLSAASSSEKFKAELVDLESGGTFRHFGITNFLEGDLFAWYLPVWSAEIEKIIRDMVRKFDDYNPHTLAEEPTKSRDLLKKLYQELFPKKVRHDLGEYYTPDWLAEHTLNEVGYDGDPDQRVLDPSCGSGTFLVLAINRVRRWYEQRRGEKGAAYEEADLCRKVLANVIGFDLNPLAVMAARTNYLIAIRGLISGVDRIEIPVYLCDSILTPSSYGGLFAGETGASKEIKTAAAKFIVPTEIAHNREDVTKYAEALEFCVRNEYSPTEFLERCGAEGLKVSKTSLHTELYKELVALDKANKNGVWARIIKNSFAPLFVGKVDFVVGNPPWVNWESLPSEYRDVSLPLWDLYRLRDRTSRGGRLGNVKKELSALFVYLCADQYLDDGGLLGFVITQSIFKTGANEGFRRFRLRSDRAIRVQSVSDLSLLLPFDGAINRTAVLVVEAGASTQYPVDYRVWIPKGPEVAMPDLPLSEVQKRFRVGKWLAAPVEPSSIESAWLTAPKPLLAATARVLGDRSPQIMDRAYAGSCTWLNGVFWVEPVRASTRAIVIRNMANIGKRKVEEVTMPMEAELIFPLLRGRDLKAWRASPSGHVLVPHDRESFGTPLSVARLKREFPKALAYFRNFETLLRSRSGYRQLFKDTEEFYVVGNVGDYTLVPYKVVFKELTDVFQCAVVGPSNVGAASAQPVIPDHKLLFLTCHDEAEAMFFAGLLNSIPSRTALYGASMGVQTQSYYPTDVSRVRLPSFKPTDRLHREIADLSWKCHAAATDADRLVPLETDLAEHAAQVWGITPKELEGMREYYLEILSFRGASVGPAEGE